MQQGNLASAETEARLGLGDPSSKAAALALLGSIRLQQRNYEEGTASADSRSHDSRPGATRRVSESAVAAVTVEDVPLLKRDVELRARDRGIHVPAGDEDIPLGVTAEAQKASP